MGLEPKGSNYYLDAHNGIKRSDFLRWALLLHYLWTSNLTWGHGKTPRELKNSSSFYYHCFLSAGPLEMDHGLVGEHLLCMQETVIQQQLFTLLSCCQFRTGRFHQQCLISGTYSLYKQGRQLTYFIFEEIQNVCFF